MLRYVQNQQATIDNLLANDRTFTGKVVFSKVPTMDITAGVPLSIAGDQTIDPAIDGTVFRKVGGAATITLTNLKEMEEILIFMENLAVAYDLTFVATGLTIRSQVPRPITASTNSVDIYSLVKVGTNLIITTALGYS